MSAIKGIRSLSDRTVLVIVSVIGIPHILATFYALYFTDTWTLLEGMLIAGGGMAWFLAITSTVAVMKLKGAVDECSA